MGQATVDLPDPMQTPPVSAANTDDLLAQLAGDEIDRLLAEADTAPVETKPAPASPANAAPARQSNGKSEPIQAPPAAGRGAPSAVDAISSELNQLLSGLDEPVTAPRSTEPAAVTAEVHSPPEPAAPPAQSAPVGPAVEAEVNAVAAELDEDARMSAGRGALAASDALANPTAEGDIPTPTESTSDLRLPFYLRPLSWLNAPLESCPDHVRDTVGKIAILTMVNALSILVYVLFFRAH